MNFNKHFVQDLDNGMFYLKDKPGMEQMEHYTHAELQNKNEALYNGQTDSLSFGLSEPRLHPS